MKKFCTLFFAATLLAGTLQLSAQSWGYAGYGHWIGDVDEAPDGSFWATGYGGEMADWSDVSPSFMVKLNSDGTLDWQADVSPTYSDYQEISSLLPVVGGGAVALAGYSYYGPILYKVADDGTIVWTNETWYNTLGFFYYYGGQLTQLSDGRLIVGGLSDDLIYHFAEVADDGTLLSTFEFEADTLGWGWSYFDYLESGIVSTDDGGFAFSSGTGDGRTLTKFASDLSIEWNTSYPHDVDVWEYNQIWMDGLSKTLDGGYLLAGSSSDAFGTYKGTLRKIASDGSLEWLQYISHAGAWAEEGSIALQLNEDQYAIWTQDAGDQSSHVWILDELGNQVDSVFVPIAGCNWGYGTGLETWSATNTSDGGYIFSGRQYMADCDQRFTIIKSDADGSLPACIWDCVWPGDANNDMYALADDIFEIGINYGATGTNRIDPNIDWAGKLANEWMEEDTLYWYILNDLKYTDCNGDGIINDDDTSAVVSNLGLDHPINTLKTTTGDIPLKLVPTETELHIGLNQIPIVLGDEINSVEEIYGISFSIEIEGESILGNSMKVNFTDSWMTNTDNRISISKNFGDYMIVSAGLVRKDRENIGGNGEIGTLDVVVIDNISGKTESEEVTFTFTNVKAIKLNREEIALAPETLTFGVEETESINTYANNGIEIYPNIISSNQFEITSDQIIEGIKIMDLAGKTLFNQLYTNALNTITVSGFDLAAGQYMVEIISENNNQLEKIIVQ